MKIECIAWWKYFKKHSKKHYNDKYFDDICDFKPVYRTIELSCGLQPDFK